MKSRNIRDAFTATLLTCGMVAFAPGRGYAQDASALPEQGGPITLRGCLQQQDEKFVLLNSTTGAATPAPDATCEAATAGEGTVKLEKVEKRDVDQSMIGHWVEVSGNLEKVEGKNDRRELNVTSMKAVAVEAPRTAEVAPAPEPPAAVEPTAPAPQQEAYAPQAQQPVGTTGVGPQQLPQTASAVPLIGLIGLLSLVSGMALRRSGVQKLG